MKNSAKLLLEFSIILGIFTLITTYIVSTTSGRVAPFIPIISEMPFSEPEESIFSTGLGISLFGTFLVVFWKHYHGLKCVKHNMFLLFFDEQKAATSFKKHRMLKTHQFLTFSSKVVKIEQQKM